uniref:PiggyBac transposable element-derived protein domain-containing protein n=1 Tax=Octopus bimaculoides TaxID=37653 RepID=A0A0L8IDA1_OCTBM
MSLHRNPLSQKETGGILKKKQQKIEFDDLSETDSDDAPLASFSGNKNPKLAKVNVAQPTTVFTKPSGVAKDIQEMQEPIPYAIFRKLFTDNIIEHIVFHTNLYAVQPGKNLVPITAKKTITFLAINLMLGVKHLPSYRD